MWWASSFANNRWTKKSAKNTGPILNLIIVGACITITKDYTEKFTRNFTSGLDSSVKFTTCSTEILKAIDILSMSTATCLTSTEITVVNPVGRLDWRVKKVVTMISSD